MEKDLHNGRRWDPRKGPRGPDKKGKTISPDEMKKKSLDTLTDVFKKSVKEDAPVNAVGGGNIAGVGVGPQGQPGVKPDVMKKYKDKNAAEAPKAGRKTFSMFMQGK